MSTQENAKKVLNVFLLMHHSVPETLVNKRRKGQKKNYLTNVILHGISEFPKILKSLVDLVLRMSCRA